MSGSDAMLCYTIDYLVGNRLAMLWYANMRPHRCPTWCRTCALLCRVVLYYAMLCVAMLHHGFPAWWGAFALCSDYGAARHLAAVMGLGLPPAGLFFSFSIE
eukprot:7104096-Pyramimonas_sp.AAC.1